MIPKPDFTMQDLEAIVGAMQAKDEASGEGVTVAELRAVLGWDLDRIRRRLRELGERGQLRLCRRMITTLNGRQMPTVAYAIKTDGRSEGNGSDESSVVADSGVHG